MNKALQQQRVIYMWNLQKDLPNRKELSNAIYYLWRKFVVYNFYHSSKKQKDSLEIRDVFSWILILIWNFGGGPSDSTSAFFKIASASCFWCYENYNWLFYMLDKDNIIGKSVSEAVDKIPTDEKDYRKCTFTWFTLYRHSIQRATLRSYRPTYS